MSRPAISVIIPTFNRAQLALQAVKSVLAQTFSDFEVIVVDDGSTDDTKEVLAPFTSSPNFNYQYQPNSGRSSARNLGAKLAQGEFILFLDSDDMLFPDALAKLYQVAQRTTAGLIFGQVQFIDENESDLWLLEPTPKARQGGLTYPFLISERYVLLQGATLFSASCMHKVGGFDRPLEPCEDYDFCLRAVLECGVAYVETPVLRCRVHCGNTDMKEIYEASLRVAQRHLRLLEQDSIPAWVRRTGRANWMLRVAHNNYNLRRNREALKYYLRALSLQPALVLDFAFDRQILASLMPELLRERLKLALRPNKGLPDL